MRAVHRGGSFEEGGTAPVTSIADTPMIVETVALFATATLFGGMLLYSFGFAPLVFTKLPVAQASKLRDAFPFYFVFDSSDRI